MCSQIEDVRKNNPMTYKMLQGIVQFAIRMKGTMKDYRKEIADLISRPPKLFQTEAAIYYLMINYSRIFRKPSPDDVGYSRCRPPNARVKEQLEGKAMTEASKA